MATTPTPALREPGPQGQSNGLATRAGFEAAALVKTGDKSDPGACAHPPRGVMWLHPDGSLSALRCGRSNDCWRCARAAALEVEVMLQLDARRNGAPTVGMTVTTAARRTSAADLRRAVEAVFKALRRRWPGLEYCAFVEWTTGTAATSGGVRRVHVHFLLKGLPVASCADAEQLLRQVWKGRTGAHRVEVRELRSAGGATAYLALHHRKMSQGPPPGYRGFRRLRPSRGYFDRPGRELRAEARELLADKRFRKAVEHRVDELMLQAGAAVERVEVDEDGRVRQVVEVVDADLWDKQLEWELESAEGRREYERPVLVRVRQREVVDQLTGELSRELVSVGEPVYRSRP